VPAHKFKNPKKLSKRFLIDADQLSDAFKEQFYSDAREYKILPSDLYNFRLKNNKFYTKTAQILFQAEINKRKKELCKKHL